MASLQAAKLAEEGDHDLERATKEYQAVVSRFDSLRPQAAEALFRLAEVATKLGNEERARSLHTRIITEFADLNEPATRSRERLASEAPGPLFSMPPELAARYGLVRTFEGGNPATAQGQAQPPPPPVTVNLTGGRLDALATLRGETAQVSAQLRKVRRELQAISIENPNAFPASLIEDTEMLTLLKGYDEALRKVDGMAENVTREYREMHVSAMNRARSQFLRGLEIHRSRLESAQRILTEELAALEKEIRKATPKF
ncbi:MAG: hypothetical protein KF791_09000 [Verrucomicrobiae bacterium]|nr:hypothetical protein [Verrucomicrobiae bacterium]